MAECLDHTPVKKSRAVVLGGSIAGLASAAAISQHFDEITILERENSAGLEVRDGELRAKFLLYRTLTSTIQQSSCQAVNYFIICLPKDS